MTTPLCCANCLLSTFSFMTRCAWPYHFFPTVFNYFHILPTESICTNCIKLLWTIWWNSYKQFDHFIVSNIKYLINASLFVCFDLSKRVCSNIQLVQFKNNNLNCENTSIIFNDVNVFTNLVCYIAQPSFFKFFQVFPTFSNFFQLHSRVNKYNLYKWRKHDLRWKWTQVILCLITRYVLGAMVYQPANPTHFLLQAAGSILQANLYFQYKKISIKWQCVQIELFVLISLDQTVHATCSNNYKRLCSPWSSFASIYSERSNCWQVLEQV